MLCILPADTVSAKDVSTHIHHMLIEAVCREYDIKLVKVSSLSVCHCAVFKKELNLSVISYDMLVSGFDLCILLLYHSSPKHDRYM